MIPHDAEAEKGALGCVLDAVNGDGLDLLQQLHPDHFYDIRHTTALHGLRMLAADRKPLDVPTFYQWLKDNNRLEDAGGIAYVSALPDGPLRWAFPSLLETLQDRMTRRAILRDTDQLAGMAEDRTVSRQSLQDAVGKIAAAYSTDTTSFAERLKARRFNINVRPPEQPPRFTLVGVPICTAGNLTALSAPVKSGKSATVGAMLAATLTEDPKADCLGFESDNRDGRAFINFDTDQSPEDHHRLVETAMRRAGTTAQPAWLHSYCIKGFSVPDSRRAIVRAMRDAGSIHSVILDGAADFVCDVNDPEESNAFVSELCGLSVDYSCPINAIIHLNPGTEKTRGHLGSQLERKAETNLRLERDGEAIILWSDKNRRAPILKHHAPRFAWSDTAGMFVTVDCAASVKDRAERESLMELAETVFSDRPAMRRMDLETTVKTRLTVGEKTAERKVSRMVQLAVIKKSVAGLYTFNGSTE